MIDSFDKLTISKYRELLSLDNNDEMEYGIQILAVLSDTPEEDLMALPLDEFTSLMSKTKFIYKEIDRMDYRKLGKTLTINGKKYDVIKDARSMTAGQYIDYRTYAKNEDFLSTLPYILTVFLVPSGMKYGEGYDIEDVAKELDQHLDIRTALCISDFFLHQSLFSIKVSLRYLKWMMKRMLRKETNQEMREKMITARQQIDLLESLITSTDGFTRQSR